MKYSVTTQFWTINSDGTLIPRTEVRQAKFKLRDKLTYKSTPRLPLLKTLKKMTYLHELWISENPHDDDTHGFSTLLSPSNYPKNTSRYYAGVDYSNYKPKFFDNFEDACQYLYKADLDFEQHKEKHRYLSHEGCRKFLELIV